MDAISAGAEAWAGMTEVLGFLQWEPEVVRLWGCPCPELFSTFVLRSASFLTASAGSFSHSVFPQSASLLSSAGRGRGEYLHTPTCCVR